MKFSYRARLALIALLLVLSTFFASCDMLGGSGTATETEGTTIAQTTPEVTTPEVTTPEETSAEITTPEETTPEVTTPSESDTNKPSANSTLTIQEAIALGATKAHNTYTSEKYYVTGVITEVYNLTYGNMKLTDGEGNILTVYGTYSADGKTRYDSLDVKPVVGDTVTVYGVVGQYNNVPQVKSGWIVEHIPVTPEPDLTVPEPDGTTSLPETEEIPDEFEELNIPAYSGNKYAEINGNVPYFTKAEYTTTSYESYSDLDDLKRCGIAVACLGRDLMPTGTRGDISDVKPTGWIQASYDVVNGGYLYNRSHLIGWQLTGEDDNKQNLITGTRSFNQLGMLPFENMVADYIKETNNHVLYRVTPVFVGNELVARGVLMEAWSVEDDGEGICFNVFVYNVQPGVIIDYATGASRLEKEDTTTPEEKPTCDYIANKNTKKFHYPTCSSVAKMSEKNKEYHTATREEMIEKGYSPCGTCKP